MGRKPGKPRHCVPYVMTPDEARIVGLIREAFAGVTLGDGVGLYEGQALDDYEDPKPARRRDEKEDWTQISVDKLNQCSSSLCFFDAEGMRFHLPAFLIADLEQTYDQDIIFHLIPYDSHQRNKLTLLNVRQREVIREFLELRATDPDSLDFMEIEQSLKTFWSP